MYNESFGLRKDPFSLTPDPAFLFLTEQHREALVGLTYAILQRKGFAVLTGEAGTGKTTLLARVLQFLPSSQLQFSMIMNPTLSSAEFLELALLDFGVTDVPASKAQRIWKLKNLLLQGQRDGKVSALIVDEAHKLTPEVLEEIRMLGNFEEAGQKFLQILLVGQAELDATLNLPDLRQLKQRIGVRLSLKPLAATEVGEYIRQRWLRAGGTQPPFSPEAIEDIANASRGLPRMINSLCDNALILAFSEGVSQVVHKHVRGAAADLDLEIPPRAAAPRPAPPAPHVRPAPPVRPAPSVQPAPQKAPMVEKTPASAIESKLPRWARWTGRFRFTPRHEST